MVKYFVKISQESEVASKKSYNISEDGSVITIQRPLYNNLKSLVHNTTVTIPENEVGTGFIQFLRDMSILHDIKYNNSTEPIPDGIEVLDEYLGELGMTESYPMKKDIINLNKFLNADYLDVTPTT